MVQQALPTSDVTDGLWTAEGGPSNHYECLDGSTASDADYIEDIGNNTVAEVGLGTVTDPEGNVDHIIRWRFQSNTAGGSPERIEVHLYEGGTIRASSGTRSSRDAWSDETYTLSSGEADALTAYDDLRLRIESSNLAGSEVVWCSWAMLEVPDAAAAVDIDCTLGTITLTGQNPEIEVGTTIDCSLGTLTLTGANPEIEVGTTIDCTLGTLTLTGQNPEIEVGTTIDCSLGTITLTGQNALIAVAAVTRVSPHGLIMRPYGSFEGKVGAAGVTIECTLGTLTLTGQNPEIEVGTTINCTLGTFTLTGQNAEIEVGTTIDCTVGTLTLTGLNADIQIGVGGPFPHHTRRLLQGGMISMGG